MVYKWCVVPQCTNTSINSPNKLFVSVPTNPKKRKMWLQLAQRDPKSIVSHSNVFMCEDHFDMEKDIINYMQYKMGFSQKIFLTDKAVPTKFYCQDNHKRLLPDAGSSRKMFVKRQRIDVATECLETQSATEIIGPEELTKTQGKEALADSINLEKSVQETTKLNMHYRSIAVQTKWQNKNVPTSPLKVSTTSQYPLPCKIELEPSLSGDIKAGKRNEILQGEKSDSYFSSFESGNSSSFPLSSSSTVIDSDSSVKDDNEHTEQLQCFSNTMRLITKNPLIYVGISKEYYFLIQLLHKNTNIKLKHIMLCLKKIRLNSTFSQLGDDFGISSSYAYKLFLKNIPIITNYLRPFIVKLDKKLIKKNLPIAFRCYYHNVSCIVDCLEINIEKPSRTLHQVNTWSEYKNGNTVKYLISCTPNGLVNYVSQGFGGRTSDVTIVENCNFLGSLHEGTCILADRGFEHLEQVLHPKGIKLLRPPSEIAGAKLSNTEIRQNNNIASLKYYITRISRRLREFHMLKENSVINTDLLRVLDHVIVIVCALINLQDSLFK